jgi:hypothetical protein
MPESLTAANGRRRPPLVKWLNRAADLAAPARTQAPRQLTPEQRPRQLDKLAAGGYVTPEDSKAKKQQILDGK